MKKLQHNLFGKILFLYLFVLVTLSPLVTFADPFDASCGPGTHRDPNNTGLCLPGQSSGNVPRNVNDVLVRVVNFGLSIAAVVAIAFIVYGGFQYMTAGLNEKNAEKGKKTLQNAVIGLVVIIMSYVIVATVTNTFTDFNRSFGF